MIGLIPDDSIEVEEEEFRRICKHYDAKQMRFSGNITQYLTSYKDGLTLGYEDEDDSRFYIDKTFADKELTNVI